MDSWISIPFFTQPSKENYLAEHQAVVTTCAPLQSCA